MFGKLLGAMLISVSLGFATAAQAADDPTIHQIYAAAEAGQFEQAQRMLDKVLQDHPNSGKAYFVEAELLAKQGRMANAAAALNKAEALTPGLPFAKPESVQHLKKLVAGGSFLHTNSYSPPQPAASSSGISWGGLLLGGGLIAALVFGLRAMLSRRAAPSYMPSGNAGYGTAPMGQMPQAGGGSGIGSSIMGGLATGAAVGAGMVAGEALAHHFLDGDERRREGGAPQPSVNDNYVADDDMGGSDFGISDSSSWDDSSSGGGDDW